MSTRNGAVLGCVVSPTIPAVDTLLALASSDADGLVDSGDFTVDLGSAAVISAFLEFC